MMEKLTFPYLARVSQMSTDQGAVDLHGDAQNRASKLVFISYEIIPSETARKKVIEDKERSLG